MEEQLWNNFKKTLDNRSVWSRSIYQTKYKKHNDGEFVFLCENTGIKTILSSRIAEFQTVVSSVFQKPITKIVFEVEKTKKRAPESYSSQQNIFSYEKPVEEIIISAGINPRFSLDNYAVSPLNSVAYSAVLAATEKLGSIYNPLFVWGGVGVGKTHLVQAAVKKILENDRVKKCFVCKGETFTNEIISAIRYKSTDSFRKKYRLLDVLVIDDVQFLSGKNTAQDEFFHTFESIQSRGGQIILISDRPPQEIVSMQDRLLSRFSGGLVVDIEKPDYELRSAIIAIKAKEKLINITDSAASMLAESANDIRSLEGLLLSTYAKKLASVGGDDVIIDMDDVAGFLFKKDGLQTVLTDKKKLIQAVCDIYFIKQIHIKQKNRNKDVSEARQVIMYLLREYYSLNLSEIAHILNRQDHTTVIHGVSKIRKMLQNDTELQKKIALIKKMIL